MEIALARSFSGNHVAATLLLVGNAGASNTPKPTRKNIKPEKPLANPCNKVISEKPAMPRVCVFRLPSLSNSHPPGICNAQYVQPKAEKINPILIESISNSFVIKGAAIEILL